MNDLMKKLKLARKKGKQPPEILLSYRDIPPKVMILREQIELILDILEIMVKQKECIGGKNESK